MPHSTTFAWGIAFVGGLFASAGCGGDDHKHTMDGNAGATAGAMSSGTAGTNAMSANAGNGVGTNHPASGGGGSGHAGAGASAGMNASTGGSGRAIGGRSATGGSAASTGGNSASTGGHTANAGSGNAGACSDTCPAKNGVTVGCEKRFMFGVNYAWINFGEDFGGGAHGIAQNENTVRMQMQDMKQNGVDVVRWWMHPQFTTAAVTFDNGTPSGLGGSELADIASALGLAAEAGLHLKLTLFSFDNFRDDSRTGHSLNAIVSDAKKKQALIDNVVRPIARAVAGSNDAERMVSWDIINEPEWAESGNDGMGDQDFDPNTELMTVSSDVMRSFVSDVASALHDESTALVTVGQAAIKWSHAFTGLGLDYYDMHYYGWVDQYYPIGMKSLADYGVGDKPVVVGEFPLDGWSNPNGTLTATQIVQKLFDAGFSGAKAWAFTQDGNWGGNKANLAAFAKSNACETAY